MAAEAAHQVFAAMPAKGVACRGTWPFGGEKHSRIELSARHEKHSTREVRDGNHKEGKSY
ncbi:hypothetical protein EJB05_14877, partial [Eragrostis curvula]